MGELSGTRRPTSCRYLTRAETLDREGPMKLISSPIAEVRALELF